jgi:hypothetical protein
MPHFHFHHLHISDSRDDLRARVPSRSVQSFSGD